jgi:membrane protein DedA with SNARE-associated domain
VAIVVFFLVRQRPDNVWSEVVAPSLSVLVLVYVGYLTLNNYTLLSGTDSTAEWLLLAVPVFLAAGVVRGATRKSIDYAAQII